MAIEESKDLKSLSLEELIGNLKVHKRIIKKASEIVKAKGEIKSLALKAKKESSDEECLTFESEDKEYAMVVIDFKKFFKRRDKNQRNFVRVSWSDSGEEDDEKVKDETCLVAQASSKKFGLEESKPMKIPMFSNTKLMKDEESESVDSTKYRGMIGSVLYLTASRLDIMFSVCLCARFQEAPKTSHLEAVKCIFRYIKGTTHLGLWYPKGTDIETVVYTDSDHDGDYVDRKSTSGICTFVGCCLTSWFSKKQTALTISTTKAEYVNARKASQQALWMKQAIIDCDIRLDNVPIMCDNKGAIDLSKNPVHDSRTKYIKIRHHFLRDNVQKGHISIEKVSSVDNIADILTKPLKRESFNYLCLGSGMIEHIP
nr:hypothetical protein [Tanacetum cinerariifolium]